MIGETRSKKKLKLILLLIAIAIVCVPVVSAAEFIYLPNATENTTIANDGVFGMHYSPDGGYVAVANTTSFTILKRNGDTYIDLGNPDSGNITGYASAAWSPDGTYLLVADFSSPYISFLKRSGDNFTRLADPDVTSVHSAQYGYGVAWSPDGTHAMVGVDGGYQVIVYKRTGDTLAQIANNGGVSVDGGLTEEIVYSSDGEYVAISDWDTHIHVYHRSGDTYTVFQNLTAVEQAHMGDYSSVVFSKDSKYVIGGVYGYSRKVIVVYAWNGTAFVETNPDEDVFEPELGWQNYPQGSITTLAISQDGRLIAVGTDGSNENFIYRFVYGTIQLTEHPAIPNSTEYPEAWKECYAFSPDNDQILIGSEYYNPYYKGLNIWKYDPPPITNFTYTTSDLEATFNDTSTGDPPTGWAWFFGDEPYNQSWVQQNASSGWIARTQFSSVALPDGSIVVMGGYKSGNLNDTWRSTDKGVTWQLQNASSGWTAREQFTSVALSDSSIVLMGGDSGSTLNDTWRSIDNGQTWLLINASSGWKARDYHTSVVLSDDSIVLMGGQSDDGYQNDTWRSTDGGTTWKLQNASSGWTARTEVTSAALPNGHIIISGGYDDNGRTNDTWRSTDKGVTWTLQNASSGWSAREYQNIVSEPDGSVVLMGGNDGGYKNDTWRSIDEGLTWTQLPTAMWVARTQFTSVTLPDGSIILMGGGGLGYENDTWRMQPVGSSLQNPSHTYAGAGTYQVTLQAYNSAGFNISQKNVTVPQVGSGNYTRQDILMSTGYLLSLTFEDSKNFTVIQNVSILDNYGMNITAVDGTFNYTYPVGDVALIIHAAGYVDRTVQYTMYQDYTGIVLLEPEIPVQQIHQTTYFPHLVRISCMNYLGTPIEDMSVSAVVVESTSPYGWLSDIFGINTNETQIVNTTLSGSTDSDGSIAFLMVENLKYRIQFSKPAESINQTNYLYPKEGDYSYVFWSEAPPSVSGSVSITFWNRTNLSDGNYMDLGVKYTDTGNTTDWLRFTVYYENDTVLYTKNATTPNSWNVSYPVLVQKTSAYIWGVRANNTRYPEQIVQAQIIRFGGSPKIPYSLCPETDPDPTNPCMWNKYGALGIIFLVALLFGRATIKYASAIVSLLALFFWYIGWLDYTPLLISTIVFLGIMFYFRYAESESDI